MITSIEYALLAGRAYFDTRADINRFPIPDGWTDLLRHETQPSGFEAVAFQKSTDIVISYAGTDPDDLLGDIAADIGLATGFGSAQLVQAAEYYLQVQAANPTATITFTGHSLGGGLAALIGVFFGQRAVTFDQAPFALSAKLSALAPADVAANLKADLLAQGYSEADLSGLTNFLHLRDTNGGIPNSDLVTDINVQGEFLSSAPATLFDRIGTQTDISDGASGVSGIDLHSQALLTAFLQSRETAPSQQALNDVTYKLTDLMGMIFANSLYARSTGTANTTERNFLERLVQNESADAMVTRFTDDLWKLAQDGGLTIADDPTAVTNFVGKALTAFAMQMYYEDTANATNANKELFTEVTGSVQFDRLDVAATLDQAKGYNLYFQNYLNSAAFTDNERQLIQSLLPTLRDWYVQAGSGGMNAADVQNRGAFMLGGNGADNLTGGTQADLLVGNAGVDTLNGRGGNDVLLGGAGFDTYIYRAGDGSDTIEDSDARGELLIDNHLLVGGIRRADDPANTYVSLDGRTTFRLSGDLFVTLADGSQLTVNENFSSGQLGIRLFDLPAFGDATRTEFTQPNPDPMGLALPFFDDGNNDTRSSALQPAIDDRNNLIQALGGNDYVLSGSGDDQLYGDTGDDTLFGEGGNDRLYGGIGDDILIGDDSSDPNSGGNDYLDGGAGDDLLQGNAGNDVLIGGAGNDNLNGDDPFAQNLGNNDDWLDGGDGDDQLHGAAGNDVLIGGHG